MDRIPAELVQSAWATDVSAFALRQFGLRSHGCDGHEAYGADGVVGAIGIMPMGVRGVLVRGHNAPLPILTLGIVCQE